METPRKIGKRERRQRRRTTESIFVHLAFANTTAVTEVAFRSPRAFHIQRPRARRPSPAESAPPKERETANRFQAQSQNGLLDLVPANPSSQGKPDAGNQRL